MYKQNIMARDKGHVPTGSALSDLADTFNQSLQR